MPEHSEEIAKPTLMAWVAAYWLALFGVWPLADPGHDLFSGGLLVSLDVVLHVVGAVWLVRLYLAHLRVALSDRTEAGEGQP